MRETKQALLEHLFEGPSTAAELADSADISRTAARRHMEDLSDEGTVEAFFRQQGIGRPSKFYRITDAGRERFPRSYDLAAEELIQALLEESGEDGLETTMRSAGHHLAERLQSQVPQDAPLQERAEALVQVLRDLGFPTRLEVHEDQLVIERRDCIFLKLANRHRDAVCEHLDTTMLEHLLDTDVDLEGCLPDGREACRHALPR